jgi:general secretion pathway protein C
MPKATRARGGIFAALLGALFLTGAVTSAVVWMMHLTATSADVPEFSKPVSAAPAPAMRGDQDAVAQLFGTPKIITRELDGLQLQGIVSDTHGRGVALISVDGAPPIRVRAGGQVRDGMRISDIQARYIVLERGGKLVELALVKRPVPADATIDSRARINPASPPATPAVAPATAAPPAR